MANIISKLCNISNYTKGRVKPIEYIVLHYTANNGDLAVGNCNYFSNPNRSASAHYFVDEYADIYRSVEDKDTAWHCGSKLEYKHPVCRNNNSIGIEMCSRKDKFGKYFIKPETIKNASDLTKELMKKYNIPITNVVRHYDVTGKNCPAPMVNDGESNWIKFKNTLVSTVSSNTTIPTSINTKPNVTTANYKITEDNISNFAKAKVISNLDYWRNLNVQYVNDLFTNAKDMVSKDIDNGINDFTIALDILISAKIINSPDYWVTAAKKFMYLDSLIINIANRCKIILLKITQAEAGNQDEKGKILVMNVINNRAKSKSFPHKIYNVVFQTNAFQPTRNGAYNKAIPTDTTKLALEKVLSGVDYSQGALYFRTINGASGSWHEKALTKLFDYKDHRFYK